MNPSSAHLGHSIFALTPGNPFWPWFAGIAILAIGVFIRRAVIASAPGLEKIVALGPLFFAAPMAVFGSQHFTDAQFVSVLVPAWLPAHLFWTYFVGVALVATALAIALQIQERLAAISLAVMLFLFVLLLHIPNIHAHPKNILIWAVAMRDLGFSGGALALAVTRSTNPRSVGTAKLTTVARLLIAPAVVFFGAAHLVRPEALPACDLDQRMPTWMPGHALWAWFAAIIFIVLGTALLLNRKTQLAATGLGIAIFILLLCVYVPLVAAKPADIASGLDYFVSTMAFSGVAFLLAAATRSAQVQDFRARFLWGTGLRKEVKGARSAEISNSNRTRSSGRGSFTGAKRSAPQRAKSGKLALLERLNQLLNFSQRSRQCRPPVGV